MRKLMNGIRMPISTVAQAPFDAVYLYDLPKDERDTLLSTCGEIIKGRSNCHPKFGQYIKREVYDQYYPNGSIQQFESAIEYVREFFKRKDYNHMMFGARCFSGSKGEIFIYFWQLQYKLHFRSNNQNILEYVKELLAVLERLEKLQ